MKFDLFNTDPHKDLFDKPAAPVVSRNSNIPARDRLFAGIMGAGISYADRTIERDGDFKKLAFLPFRSLVLEFQADCPADMRALIASDAANVQAQRGEQYQVSTSGQTVKLGA